MMRIIRVFILLCIANSCLFAQDPGTVKWSYQTEGRIQSSPAIGPDGTIYFGSWDYHIYALNANGSLKWRYKTGDFVSSAAIGADGTVYAGSDDHFLYALTPGGSLKWRFETNRTVEAPVIGPDGTIYFCCNDGLLYAVSEDGVQKWRKYIGQYADSPAIGPDGTIYAGSWDDVVSAYSPEGEKKWDYHGTDYFSEPSVGTDGTVYVGSYDNHLYAFDPNGDIIWRYETDGNISGAPSIGPDGTIYVGSSDGYLYALSQDGKRKWAFAAWDRIAGSPAVGDNGTIYFGSNDGRVYALDQDGNQLWKFSTSEWVYSSPAVGNDGTLYIGSYENKLYALHTSCTGLADGIWPRYHQNNENRGTWKRLYINRPVEFIMCALGETRSINVRMRNGCSESIAPGGMTFMHPWFSIADDLPASMEPGAWYHIRVEYKPDATQFARCSFCMRYNKGMKAGTDSSVIKIGAFVEDNSETYRTGVRALTNYLTCRNVDSTSAATLNNLGLLYCLLGESDLAEPCIVSALSGGINNLGGYGGIKMNLGVVKSDQDSTEKAELFYSNAWTDIMEYGMESVLSPQISYNRAWEFYNGTQYDSAMVHVNRTMNHTKTNDWLLAKAYVLRGAIKVSQGVVAEGEADFNQAITYDPDGPIGRLAADNLWTAVGDNASHIPGKFTLFPNYPNPFNPETVIEFGLPEAGVVEAAVYNVLGEKVRTLVSDHMRAGWHRLTWQGTDDAGRPAGSGIYLLKIRTGNKVLTGKMSLLR